MDAAEHPEHHAEDERHGNGQQRAQQPVEDEFDQLEGGVASYPHSVEAVRGDGLCDDIFKADLQMRVDVVWISVRLRCVNFPLLRQDRFYRSVELVFVHNDAGVQLLLFQTHVVRSDGAGRAAGDGALCSVRRTARHPAPYGKQRSVGPRRHNKLKVTSPDQRASSVMTDSTV